MLIERKKNKIMGYKNPNVAKTIILPVPDGTKTEKEYFDEYGINIRDLFVFNGTSSLFFKERNSIFFLNNENGFGAGNRRPAIFPVLAYDYVSNASTPSITLGGVMTAHMGDGFVEYLISKGLLITYTKADDLFTLSYYEYEE